MSFHELAQPAPVVGEAKAQAPSNSKSVTVENAKSVEEPKIKAAPIVSGAIVGDYQKFAPKTAPKKASMLSVTELKKQGTSFESEAGVIKGGVEKDFLKKILPFFFDERDFVSYGEVRRFLFVKDNNIFVYVEKSDPRPLYVIELQKFRAEIEDPVKLDKHSFTISPQAGTNMPGSYFTTVLLKDKNSGKQSYQITFDTRNDNSLVKRFMDVLRINSKQGVDSIISASVINEKNGNK